VAVAAFVCSEYRLQAGQTPPIRFSHLERRLRGFGPA
jgi:hypothetical protein